MAHAQIQRTGLPNPVPADRKAEERKTARSRTSGEDQDGGVRVSCGAAAKLASPSARDRNDCTMELSDRVTPGHRQRVREKPAKKLESGKQGCGLETSLGHHSTVEASTGRDRQREGEINVQQERQEAFAARSADNNGDGEKDELSREYETRD
ncbi:hypothetical protein BO71DRAFT_200038 [Aspergillus ellipticus CBS 707.79]|uniref:Uncharacterized protein n=1 Tax=Aspergillus ellipticus CBS 707.79 TaxID=1448320 RepID=A0A319DN91_9EURO|nr:hypothetical protein BO71DRAFT_200038 [Aspergillus ellipticus CBS 707.79]